MIDLPLVSKVALGIFLTMVAVVLIAAVRSRGGRRWPRRTR